MKTSLVAFVLIASPAVQADVCAPRPEVPKLAYLLPAWSGPLGFGICTDRPSDTLYQRINFGQGDYQRTFTKPLATDIAAGLAWLPLPSSASSFTYAFDPTAGVLKRSTRSLGPIMGERAETMGKGRFTLALDLQQFRFVRAPVLGNSLGIGTSFISLRDPEVASGDSIQAKRALDADVKKATVFVNYAATERLDLSLAVPVTHIDVTLTGRSTLFRGIRTAPDPAFPGLYDRNRHYFPGHVDEYRFSVNQSRTGLGDVTLRAKANVLWSRGRALAVGADIRFPTGDALDLLGSGAWGLRPFVVWSQGTDVLSPHVTLAYDWSGKTVLAGDLPSDGKGGVLFEDKARLPARLMARVGADLPITHKATLSFDILFSYVMGFPSAYDADLTESGLNADPAVGLKVAATKRLMLVANALFYSEFLDFTNPSAHASGMVGFEYGF